MGVGVDQAEESPGESIVHPMSPLCHDLTFLRHDKAHMTRGAGRRGEVFAQCPGDMLNIPSFAKG